jgi:hypothetical protein
VKHFISSLFGCKSPRRRWTAALAVESLDARALPSVSPVGPAIDVRGIGHNVNVDPSSMGERTAGRAANGESVVVWTDTNATTGGIYYRLFDASGKPMNSPTLVEGTDPTCGAGSVSMSSSGTFAIVWTTGDDIYVQRFDANGNFVGHINPVAISPLLEENPTVALNSSGWLAVAFDQRNDPHITGQGTIDDMNVDLWTQAHPDTAGTLYAAGGSQGDFATMAPSVALNDCGQGVLAYAAEDAVGTGIISLEGFTPDGGVSWGRGDLHTGGAEYTSNDPSVAINNAGRIILTYTNTEYLDPGFRGPITGQQVIAERWNSDATFLGGQQVLEVTHSRFSPNSILDSSLERHSSVAVDAAGNFTVAAYQEFYRYELAVGEPVMQWAQVVAGVFDASGNPVTGTFAVSSLEGDSLSHWQDAPSVALDGNGNSAVSFVDVTPDGGAPEVRFFTSGSTAQAPVAPAVVVNTLPFVSPAQDDQPAVVTPNASSPLAVLVHHHATNHHGPAHHAIIHSHAHHASRLHAAAHRQ